MTDDKYDNDNSVTTNKVTTTRYNPNFSSLYTSVTIQYVIRVVQTFVELWIHLLLPATTTTTTSHLTYICIA